MINRLKQIVKDRKDIISLISFMVCLPLSVGLFFGLINAVTNTFSFGENGTANTFQERFLTGFNIFFPAATIFTIIVVIVNRINQRKKQAALTGVLVVLMLFLSWQWGGKDLAEVYKCQMEELLDGQIALGESFGNIKKTKECVSNYKIAIFLDKYIVIWNDNKGIPQYYSGIAQSYSDSEDFSNADKYYDKALEAFDKYAPEKKPEIAVTHLRAALVTSGLNNNEKTLYHALESSGYFENNMSTSDKYTAATSFVFAANAYYNAADYKSAAEYLEVAIPLYYDSVNWGFGDDPEAKMIAILYKVASLTYSHLDNQVKADEYNRLYNDFVWYRDFSDEDLYSIIDAFHWLNR